MSRPLPGHARLLAGLFASVRSAEISSDQLAWATFGQKPAPELRKLTDLKQATGSATYLAFSNELCQLRETLVAEIDNGTHQSLVISDDLLSTPD